MNEEILLPSGLTLNADRTVITASSEFDSVVDMTEYESATVFDGSQSTESVIVIGNALDNSIVGGNGTNSIYGAAGNNTLAGGTARDQFWFMGDGNATVTNFVAGDGDNSDVVTFYGFETPSVSRQGSQLQFVNESNGTTMILQTNSDNGDGIILYSMDGSEINGAKVGNAGETSLTYDSRINYYRLQGNDGTLYINTAGDEENEIILSNSSGKYFFGIKNVIANNAGSNYIDGNSESNLLVGGSGSNSLWGGYGNVSDTLQGGDGSNLFFYGSEDGNDFITNTKEGDRISFYDLSIGHISDLNIESQSIAMTFTNGNTLNIQDSGNVTPTFWIYTNVELTSDTGRQYRYDRSSSQWQVLMDDDSWQVVS